MHANLLTLVRDSLGDDFSKLAGQFLGESQAEMQTALSSLLPAVLGVVAKKGATTPGAASLMALIDGARLDVSTLDNISGLFGSGGSGAKALLKAGTGSLVPGLFGDKAGALVNALSSASGIKTASATNLLAMIVPLVLTFVKKLMGDRSLSANSLALLLSRQGPNIQGALDGRLTSALGFSSSEAFLGSLGGLAADNAARAGAAIAAGASAAATASRSGLMRWIPSLVGGVVVLSLWNLMTGTSPPTPASASAVVASSTTPAATPVMAVALLPAKVYFEVGAATIGPDGSQTLGAAAELIKKDGLKVAVTGYTDRTGDMAQNEELARRRAAAVRDALRAAGVAEASIETRPPMRVEKGAAGGEADARRVEINKR